MKKCPFCAEEILDNTATCPFCERDLMVMNTVHEPKIETRTIKPALDRRPQVSIELSKLQLMQMFVVVILIAIVIIVWVMGINISR